MSETNSIWLGTTEQLEREPLPPGRHFDVLIAGAGIVGLSTAYALRGLGLKVAVVDARAILNDVTGNTTGKLTSQHGIIYDHLIQTFGKDRSQQYADMNEWAIREVARIQVEENIDCDYTPENAYVYATTNETAEKFEAEAAACLSLGLPASIVSDPGLPYPTKGAIKFANQARYHPLKFLLGLAGKSDAEIFENTRILEIEEKKELCSIETNRGTVTADKVVIATHYPTYDSGLFVAKLAPYKSYAIAVEVRNTMPNGMFITEDEPLRSMRRQPIEGKEILIVGGGHHKVGQQEDAHMIFSDVARWADQHFGIERLLFRWSTQDNWTVDRLPYIGKQTNRDRILVATGFGGWGMTNGIASGKILADLILERENPWAECVDPGRLPMAAVPRMAKENLNAVSHLVGDRMADAQSPELSAIPTGEAAIVQLENERVAAYRDHEDNLHVVTSACTHWGCELRWNSAETTWDCPCHGSRFDIDGQVLHGPAVNPLEQRNFGEGSGVE